MSGYISKDFVHWGAGLILEPDKVWNFVPYSVKKNINKAEKAYVKVEKVRGNSDDMSILKSMWYDSNDPNLPTHLNENEFMFIAYNSNTEPIGAIILLPVGNHLFLNNLAGNQEGKSLRVQDYLLWHCVNYFSNSDFNYIDVGVSYRESLYEFFKKWQTISYPVILNVPKNKLNISINPFTQGLYESNSDDTKIVKSLATFKKILSNRNFTFLPNKEQAEKVLQNLGFELLDFTYEFLDSNISSPFVVDLTKVFSTQFGALIVNLEISDKLLWNEHKCLDYYKRDFVLTNICDELESLDVIIAKRKKNLDALENYFNLDGISCSCKKGIIPSAFYFKYDFNLRYHNKLNDFGISHFFNEQTNEIGLPVHQNLNRYHLEYLYAIFRGVLNLCSEWVQTDVYKKL